MTNEENPGATRRYYSSRHANKKLLRHDLYQFLKSLYSYFACRDYFKEKMSIDSMEVPEHTMHKAAMALRFDLFPVTDWELHLQMKDENLFDAIEYLYDHISKPGKIVEFASDHGGYDDYESYDTEAGRTEYRESVNSFLVDYGRGFELSAEGAVEFRGEHGLQHIFEAEIIPYDYDNVDRKVLDAIRKWKNRHYELEDRKQAIRDLADVFEWLKKEGKLTKALSRKDESALFDIANNFALRHHNPKQKSDYDEDIWYSWIFHFYLASYHAAIRLIKRVEGAEEAQRTGEDPS